MNKISIREIAEVTRGHLMSGDPGHYVTGVSTDSRAAGKNDLFIPIIGETHDGHEFIPGAYGNGCRAFLVSEEDAASAATDADVILVQDTAKAMQDLAYHYLQGLDIFKVAVTGSVGKTSTRDMIYYILSEKFKTARPTKNYNNEIGVPLTIFGLDSSYKAVVFEEGLHYAGDIHRLSRMTRPDLAVITNVGVAHIENLGSRENIFKAKLEVADFLPQDGALIVNSDSDFLKKENIDREFRIISCGEDPTYDICVHDIKDKGALGISFTLTTGGKSMDIGLPVPGAHNAVNAALAAAVAIEAGLTLSDVKNGLAKLELTGKRLLVKKGNDRIVIDDSYNASPDSMKSAINTLINTEGERHVAIFAGMNELGDDSEEFHKEVGRYAAEKQLDVLVCVGEKAKAIADGAEENAEGGADGKMHIYRFADKEAFFKEMDNIVLAGDTVIVKGSNAYKMSEVADRLVGGQN